MVSSLTTVVAVTGQVSCEEGPSWVTWYICSFRYPPWSWSGLCELTPRWNWLTDFLLPPTQTQSRGRALGMKACVAWSGLIRIREGNSAEEASSEARDLSSNSCGPRSTPPPPRRLFWQLRIVDGFPECWPRFLPVTMTTAVAYSLRGLTEERHG